MKVIPPFVYEPHFQNRGCFIYFKEQGPRLLSAETNAQVQGEEAVLLNCGSHFLEILKEKENEEIHTIVIHMYPEILKNLYIEELPSIIERHTSNKRSEVIASKDVISKFVESLEFYFQNPSLVNDDLLELKIKELILLLIQSKNVNSILDLISDLYSPKTVQLKEVVQLHLFSNLKVNQLAKLCNLGLSTFKREFKKEYNDTPTNYIIGKKIEKAKKLLKTTNMLISEVGYEVGFSDQLYFTRIFKKRTGSNPSNYRAHS